MINLAALYLKPETLKLNTKHQKNQTASGPGSYEISPKWNGFLMTRKIASMIWIKQRTEEPQNKVSSPIKLAAFQAGGGAEPGTSEPRTLNPLFPLFLVLLRG